MKWQNIPHSFKNRHIIALEIAKKKNIFLVHSMEWMQITLKFEEK